MPQQIHEPMNPLTHIRERARALKRTVVFPEGSEPRTLQAAKKLLSEGTCSVILLGETGAITEAARSHNVNLSRIQIINPCQSPEYKGYAQQFYEMRRHKGMSENDAHETMRNALYFGAMMVRQRAADATVAGAVNTTSDVLRAAIQVLGMKAGIKTVSSSFLMVFPQFRETRHKAFIFGDCAVVPEPDAEQLASIAISCAETYRLLLNEEPKVAMLSFSTKGSASHASVTKVTEALRKVRLDQPGLKIDGELQLDAAIMPEVGSRKAPGSEIAGQANVLVFPNLDAGNIGYKLAERFGGATAKGPIIQGLNLPANDLSRGCTVDDIVDTTAIALLMRGA